jgi:hypothetical protein
MGNVQECQNIDSNANACEIHKCVENVIGIPVDSASPTDTWIMQYFSGTKYLGKLIDTGFMKWWVSRKSLRRMSPTNEYLDVEALDYEVEVYKDIVRPMVDFNICPNFVRYLGSKKECTYDQLFKIINGKMYSCETNTKLSKDQSELNLKNTILSLYTSSQRDIINSNKVFDSENNPKQDIINEFAMYEKNLFDTLKYTFLINEAVFPGSKKYYNWLVSDREQPSWVDKYKGNDEDHYIFWEHVFQVLASAYASSLSRMVINDNHLGNYWVEPVQVPEEVTDYIYNIDGVEYVLNNVTHKVMVYDFDRAYVESIGQNPLLSDDYLCTWNSRTQYGSSIAYNQCNEYVENKDALKFLAQIYSYLETPNFEIYRQQILDIIVHPTSQYRQDVEEVFNGSTGTYLTNMKKQQRWDANFMGNLRSTRDMIDIVGNIIGATTAKPRHNPEYHIQNTFVCNADMFNSDGTLKVTSNVVLPHTRDKLNREKQLLQDKIQDINKNQTIIKPHIKSKTISLCEHALLFTTPTEIDSSFDFFYTPSSPLSSQKKNKIVRRSRRIANMNK